MASQASRRTTSAGTGPTPAISATASSEQPTSNSSGACTTTRGRATGPMHGHHRSPGDYRPTPRSISHVEERHQLVVEPLVVGHVPERDLTRAPRSTVFFSLSPARAATRRTRDRLRHGVIVLGERDPDRLPRVVEAQRPPLELPAADPPTPRHLPAPRGRAAFASARFASSRALCQAANSRACRTFQVVDASRRAASLEGEATSAKGSTRSSDSSPTPAPRPGRAGLEVDRRTNPLAGGRRADPALAGDPGDHRDGAVTPPALGSVELGDVGQLLPEQCRDPGRPLHDQPRQLLRAGVAAEIAARWPAAQRPRARASLRSGRRVFDPHCERTVATQSLVSAPPARPSTLADHLVGKSTRWR